MQVSQGKQFRFSLQGETLPLDACKLWQTVPPSPLATYRLMPVAIGTTLALAPLQSTELINTGAQDLSYAIHLGPLAASAQGASAYGFQNMYLENPVGVIPARSTHFLQWRFLPLEAREYTYALPITYRRSGNSSTSGGGGGSRHRGEQGTSASDRGSVSSSNGGGSRSARHSSNAGAQRRNSSAGGSGVAAARAAAAGASEPPVFTETLCIAAAGYDPREEDPHAEAVPEIATGLVPPPYQLLTSGMGTRLAVLSLEKLHLGRLPQRARRTELVVLRNPNPAGTNAATVDSAALTAADGPFGPNSNNGSTSALAASGGSVAASGGGNGGGTAGQAVDYAWDVTHPLVSSGLLVITPMKGRIPAGGFATVTFSVVADCAPCIVDAQVAVHCCPAPEEDDTNGYHRRRGGTRGTSRGSMRGGGGGSRASLTGGDLATARSAAVGSGPPSPTGESSGNAGANGGAAAGSKGIAAGAPDGRATIASRSTPSRNAMLEVTRARVESLTGHVPKLPTRPPTPPKTGEEDEEKGGGGGGAGGGNGGMGRAPSAATAPPASSGVSGGGAATARSMAAGATGRTSNNGGATGASQPGTFLHVFLWFEVVHEEAFVSLFKADVNAVRIPRPRKFIPEAPLPRDLDAPALSPPLLPGADGTATTAASSSGAVNPGVAAAERRASLRTLPSTGGGSADHGAGKGSGAVVQHAHHLRSRSETATAVLSGFFGAIFADALESSEVRAAVLALPQQPKIPLYRDLKAKADLMLRLENAFRVFDTDNSGKLSTKEIKHACRTMGLKAKTKEAKAFMRALDEDQDGEVNLKEFLSASMPPEVSLALEEAIENMEHQARLKRKEERRIARMFAVVQDSSMTADKAAMQIQGKFRKRQAAKKMALKKLLALNPEARAQNNAANLLQGQVRGRKARADAREKAELKTQVMRQLALGDADFQGLIGNLVEDCVGNLVAEALHGEFDLGPPPKQYALATEHYLNDDDDEDDDDDSKVEHKATR